MTGQLCCHLALLQCQRSNSSARSARVSAIALFGKSPCSSVRSADCKSSILASRNSFSFSSTAIEGREAAGSHDGAQCRPPPDRSATAVVPVRKRSVVRHLSAHPTSPVYRLFRILARPPRRAVASFVWPEESRPKPASASSKNQSPPLSAAARLPNSMFL
jgi:hypothetical protein